MIATLLQIAAMFSVLSLLAFGGGAAVLPDMQRQAVELHHWLSNSEFLDMFALSRAIPPGSKTAYCRLRTDSKLYHPA